MLLADLDRETKWQLISSTCRASFEEFCREHWQCVPGAGRVFWNWHMTVICRELQEMAERVFAGTPREHDLVVNISPGTSKSTLASILFPAWAWTRMPECRIITASHTEALVLDFSGKSRDVVKHPKYQRCFPEVRIRGDRDARGEYMNTAGGERRVCTVAGKTPTGLHAHCFPYETEVITERGAIPIGELVEGKSKVRVLSYNHAEEVAQWQEVESHAKSEGSPLCRVWFADQTSLELTEDHPVYVARKGYVPAVSLLPGDEVIHGHGSDCMSGMREAVEQGTGGQGRQVLQQQVQRQARWSGKVRVSEKEEYGAVRHVRQAFLQGPSRSQAKELLFAGMSGKVNDGGRASKVQFLSEEVRRVRVHDDRGTPSVEDPAFLQQSVLSCSGEGSTSPLVSTKDQSELRTLWTRDQGGPIAAAGKEGRLLFKGLRRQGSFSSNEGGGQFKLCSREVDAWRRVLPISGGVCCPSEGGKAEGKTPLLFVRQASEAKRAESGCASHRLRHLQQLQKESGGSVPPVSQSNARGHAQPPSLGTKVVRVVERGVRLPSTVYNLQVAANNNYFAGGILVHNCLIVDDPIDPKRVLSDVERQAAADFMTDYIANRKVDKAVSATVLIMQRLGVGDPTDVVLAQAKVPGAAPVRHVCLPAELPDEKTRASVSPPELLMCYGEDGLMDPVRLPRSVLAENKAKGDLFYSTQFLQAPYVRGGGMFKAHFFLQRVRAAPYHARRVLYFDRAFTANEDSCHTVGTVLAHHEGNWYVGPVKSGKWWPHERDLEIVGMAQQCRDRWGPNNEPDVVVEREPAAGIDSYRALAAKLAGFRVHADPVRVNKEQRADPWASQCAAGNVILVNDGTWNIEEWIRLHCAFPGAARKDEVDSSGGAFNWLVQRVRQRSLASQFRILSLRSADAKEPLLRLVVCSRAELEQVTVEERSLLVNFVDPPAPCEGG